MINDNASLAQLLERLALSPWIAVDTEADSLHAYPEKICLIQISHAGGDELVDPLAGIDLGPLWKSFEGRELIMHGSDYDLRMFRRCHEFAPSKVFDTMIAARILGETVFGLSALVEKHLQVTLEKGPQKMNWALRPLPSRMEVYARNDTHYLKPLYDLLKGELISRGREQWAAQTCQQLIVECSRPEEPDLDREWRVKGTDRLSPRAQAIVRELYYWREKEARKSNRPPFFILSHENITRLAESCEKGQMDLSTLTPRFSDRRRGGVKAAIEKALELKPSEWPRLKRIPSRYPSRQELDRFDELKKQRDELAQGLGIDPTMVATKSGLLALASETADLQAELLPWQRQLLQSAPSQPPEGL